MIRQQSRKQIMGTFSLLGFLSSYPRQHQHHQEQDQQQQENHRKSKKKRSFFASLTRQMKTITEEEEHEDDHVALVDNADRQQLPGSSQGVVDLHSDNDGASNGEETEGQDQQVDVWFTPPSSTIAATSPPPPNLSSYGRIQALPDNVLVSVFSKLSLQDRLQCSVVCKRWHKNTYFLIMRPLLSNDGGVRNVFDELRMFFGEWNVQSSRIRALHFTYNDADPGRYERAEMDMFLVLENLTKRGCNALQEAKMTIYHIPSFWLKRAMGFLADQLVDLTVIFHSTVRADLLAWTKHILTLYPSLQCLTVHQTPLKETPQTYEHQLSLIVPYRDRDLFYFDTRGFHHYSLKYLVISGKHYYDGDDNDSSRALVQLLRCVPNLRHLGYKTQDFRDQHNNILPVLYFNLISACPDLVSLDIDVFPKVSGGIVDDDGNSPDCIIPEHTRPIEFVQDKLAHCPVHAVRGVKHWLQYLRVQERNDPRNYIPNVNDLLSKHHNTLTIMDVANLLPATLNLMATMDFDCLRELTCRGIRFNTLRVRVIRTVTRTTVSDRTEVTYDNADLQLASFIIPDATMPAWAGQQQYDGGLLAQALEEERRIIDLLQEQQLIMDEIDPNRPEEQVIDDRRVSSFLMRAPQLERVELHHVLADEEFFLDLTQLENLQSLTVVNSLGANIRQALQTVKETSFIDVIWINPYDDEKSKQL